MKDYILLLPIIFIFHDMEEIIGFGWFFGHNQWLYDRFPKVMKPYRGFTYMGFAAAVYEEFIPFFGVSLLACFFPCSVLYGLWYGIFLSLAGHFLIHIGHTVYIRRYIPCVLTSIICLPVSVVILIKTAGLMTFDLITTVSIILGIAGMIANMKLIYKFMPVLNRRIREDEENRRMRVSRS